MNRKALRFFGLIFVFSSIPALGSGYVQAQTQDQVAKFDASGNPVDSAITETGGNVGIGTTNPSSRLEINAQDGLKITGYQPFLTLVDASTGGRGRIQSANGSILFYPHYNLQVGYPGVVMQYNGLVGINNIYPDFILDLPNQPNILGRGRANAWVTYSSRRWKENITPIDNALAKVERLRGVYYDWKENKAHDIGLIAEEVGEVIPEVVTYEKNGKDAVSVDYARLTALLVEAVKELKAENKALERRIEVLESASSTVQAPAVKSSTFALLGLGTLGLIGYAWRRRQRAVA